MIFIQWPRLEENRCRSGKTTSAVAVEVLHRRKTVVSMYCTKEDDLPAVHCVNASAICCTKKTRYTQRRPYINVYTLMHTSAHLQLLYGIVGCHTGCFLACLFSHKASNLTRCHYGVVGKYMYVSTVKDVLYIRGRPTT